MKAMLIWSDGCSLHYNVFEDKDNETGFERAQEQMHKEYDERNASGAKADIELGACKAATFCNYVADGADSCIWQIVEFPDDNPLPAAITSYSDACETRGAMTLLLFTAAITMSLQINLQILSGSAAMRRIMKINLKGTGNSSFLYAEFLVIQIQIIYRKLKPNMVSMVRHIRKKSMFIFRP